MSGGGAAPRRAEILAIGDELVHGLGIDTNSAHIARELEVLGFEVRGFTVVSDEPEPLLGAIRAACARADVVVATGGLGPTEDDRTRAAAAAAAEVDLIFDDGSWRHIEELFARRSVRPPERNRVQAYLPAGAQVLRNDWGTAPGFALEIADAMFLAMPGVPREMKSMLSACVLPAIRDRFGVVGGFAFVELRVVGLHEAELGEQLAERMQAGRNPRVGVTAHFGVLTVRIAAHDVSVEAAEARCEEEAALVRPLLGEHMIYEGQEPIEHRVATALIESGATIAVAESCTGGLIASELAGVPGVSEVLLAGYVTYSNEAKVRDLGVPQELIDEHGAVSEPVAAAMADGAARRAGARFGVAVTGIAGPGGAVEGKPVGTVCFAISVDGETAAFRRDYPDLGRRFIRHRSAMEVFAAILRRLA